MEITWLGQAGLLFDTGDTKIMVDPYLSDSVGKQNPKNRRRVAVDKRFLKITPDILICTHNHLDHTDPETLAQILNTEKAITVLAPFDSWHAVRAFGKNHNYVMFNRLSHWTEGDIHIKAVRAEHSDKTAIGAIIQHEQTTYYLTGDTLYNDEIFPDLPARIDVIFLPINGAGNNMNMTDAQAFAEKAGATTAVPLHFGMFDSLDPHEFAFKNKVIPQIFEVIKL
jgi:L-ascorbate metabolism protein UlaG (beta-lactamase superfamily)